MEASPFPLSSRGICGSTDPSWKCFRRTLLRHTFGQETITDPGFGLDVLARALGFKFPPKLANKHAQILWLMSRLATPYCRQQCAMRQSLARITRHVKQQIEFRGCQVQTVAAHGHGVGTG